IENVSKLMKLFHAFHVGASGANSGNTHHVIPFNVEGVMKPVIIPVLEQGNIKTHMVCIEAPVALHMLK
ncbi:MAG TPA: hypothetical protein VLI68_00560, partial [Hanamia sp.]|nr:hypothetical protein [Hanamia sp.]